MNLEKAQKLYMVHVGKRFDMDHWYEMLKDQPKWKKLCDLTNLGSESSKRSHSEAEGRENESVGGGERPEGRKAAKRRLKEKPNNTIFDLVTTQMQSLTSANTEMSKVFKDFVNKS